MSGTVGCTSQSIAGLALLTSRLPSMYTDARAQPLARIGRLWTTCPRVASTRHAGAPNDCAAGENPQPHADAGDRGPGGLFWGPQPDCLTSSNGTGLSQQSIPDHHR